MATWVTPCSASQSDRANRSRVMVENVRTSSEGLPGRSQQRTQTTTLALWTSMPAQRGGEGIHEVLRANLFAEDLEKQTICYACSPHERGQPFPVPYHTQPQLHSHTP